MTREEFLIEFKWLKAQLDDTNREQIFQGLLSLTHICMEERQPEWGLEVAKYALPILQADMENASGMKFQELSDFLLENKEYADPRWDLYWEFVLECTRDDFELFMKYMEKNRPYAKKFYEPRAYTRSGKPAMKRVADALQGLTDRLYKFLGISLPSRSGKSTICIFYLCFRANRNPNSHSAMGGHAGTLVKGFYKELLNLMTSSEYTYAEIYERWHPAHTLIRDKSAEDYTITLDEPDRFATITCRGIDATWTGAVDVSRDGLLYVDDLVRDRQHSLSPTRMEETYQEYLNKMVDRKNDGAQELMVGTLWNVLDPLERLSHQYADDPDYCFLRIPALDDDDESNFDYVINGFSTAYYKDMRDRLDTAEWMAKFQQRPFVREGLIFQLDTLKYYNGMIHVPDVERVIAVCDPAFGGGDYLSMPICYEMKDGHKPIVGWVYDKRPIEFTLPRVLSAIKQYGVTELRVERTGAGLMLGDKIREELKANNVFGCMVTQRDAPRKCSKEDKILGRADFIKENFEFIEIKAGDWEFEDTKDYEYHKRDADYNRAMDDLGMFSGEGKNAHDDSPDSLAQLAIMCEDELNGQIEVIKNPYME